MIKIDFPAGTDVERAIRYAKSFVSGTGGVVECKINGIDVHVSESTDTHALYVDYLRVCNGFDVVNLIGPVAKSSSAYRVVVVIYDEIEECKYFSSPLMREMWMVGAIYGADKYGGSICLYTENVLPDDKSLRGEVLDKLLSLVESEEST